ncbi:carboxymuconolactone decarboxylase family protein [Agromyces sp. NPDC058104]|uniref:carboxymuconolactone decarboxylase family protein n=1 Tax=Agromyces sp. NPDC058104 TaxID=3346342 RepID=UPI0036DB0A20
MDHLELLRRLAIDDDRLSGESLTEPGDGPLSPKALALARLGALCGVGGTDASFSSAVDAAIRAGATGPELVHLVVAVVPVVGMPRAVAAAQHLAVALGLDLETFVPSDS